MGWEAKPRYKAARNQWVYRWQGREHYLCSGRNSEHEAWQKAMQIKGGTIAAGTVPSTVAELVERWLLLYGKPSVGQVIDGWNVYTGKMPLRELTEDSLLLYMRELQKRGLKPASVRKYVLYVLRVLRFARKRGWVDFEPERPKLPKIQTVYKDLPVQELAALLDKLNPRARLVCKFMLFTGARPGEACRLQWADVQMDAAQIILVEHKTADSSGRARVIRLPPAALELLQALPGKREGYVFLNRCRRPYSAKGLGGVCAHAGFYPYQLRHTFAQLARGHIDIYTIMVLMGHTNLKTTQNYCHVKNHEAAQAAKALPSPLPPVQLPPRKAGSGDGPS